MTKIKLTASQRRIIDELRTGCSQRYNGLMEKPLKRLEALGLVRLDVEQRCNALRPTRSSLWWVASLTGKGHSLKQGTAEICSSCKHIIQTWYDHADNCPEK